MAKRLTYVEIPTRDAARAARFYQAVLGWKTEQRSEGDFRFSDDDAQLIGRWVTGRPSGEPGIVSYFTVDRIADSVARAPEHGGEVVEAPRPEGDVLVARLRDPDGNLIGIWQFTERRP